MPNSSYVVVKDVTLKFSLDFFRPSTWRDNFVRLFRFRKDVTESAEILNQISFELKDGDRVALLGRNGAGKSTLCRCIAGIYSPTSGTIETNGNVRALFDSSVAFFPELTGRENISILMNLLHPEPTQKQKDEIAEFSGIGSHLDRQLKFYSTGMQARLALSVLSCQASDILILDEVFDGADIGFRKKISERMKTMIDQSGIVIFVSHSIDQVRDTCNRVIVVDHHQIIHDGDVEKGLEIYSQVCDLPQ